MVVCLYIPSTNHREITRGVSMKVFCVISAALISIVGSQAFGSCEVVITKMGDEPIVSMIYGTQTFECQKSGGSDESLACSWEGRSTVMSVQVDVTSKEFHAFYKGADVCQGTAQTANEVNLLSYRTCSSLRGGLTPLPVEAALTEDYGCGLIPGEKNWVVCQPANWATHKAFVIHRSSFVEATFLDKVPSAGAFVQYCN